MPVEYDPNVIFFIQENIFENVLKNSDHLVQTSICLQIENPYSFNKDKMPSAFININMKL